MASAAAPTNSSLTNGTAHQVPHWHFVPCNLQIVNCSHCIKRYEDCRIGERSRVSHSRAQCGGRSLSLRFVLHSHPALQRHDAHAGNREKLWPLAARCRQALAALGSRDINPPLRLPLHSTTTPPPPPRYTCIPLRATAYRLHPLLLSTTFGAQKCPAGLLHRTAPRAAATWVASRLRSRFAATCSASSLPLVASCSVMTLATSLVSWL